MSRRDSLGAPVFVVQPVARYTVASLLALFAVLVPVGRIDRGTSSSHLGTMPVVVSAMDIPEGFIVDRLALVVAQWPVGTLPAGAYTSVDSVAGRVARVAIYKGEAIVPGRLMPFGREAELDVRITPGKRAYAIPIDDIGSLAGMIQPNSRVDVMVLINYPDQKRLAKLFMENVRVLAIGADRRRAEDGRSVNRIIVSVEVTPSEAERLAIASAQGALQLVLRGYGDPDSITGKARSPTRDFMAKGVRPERAAPPVRRQREP